MSGNPTCVTFHGTDLSPGPALRQHFDTTQIVELISAIATYNMVARFLVALGVSPET